MVLVIDVGNTNIVVGAYEGDKLVKTFRISTMYERSSDEVGILLTQLLQYYELDILKIEDVIISSVVPQVMFSLERAVKKYLNSEPLVVNSKLKTGLKIAYDNPAEVGADRIVNAVAVMKKYPGKAIVIDFGTATTFCAIGEEKTYLGGVICPGIKISLDALISKTAKLPKIELVKPEKIIGTNTISSMQSGMIYGYAGQIEYIVTKMKEEMGEGDIRVIATGGMASLIALATDAIDILEPNLTVYGLKVIYDMNK